MGEDMMRGFELALEEMNGMGGIGGRPVEHIALDASEFAPDVLVNNFRRLITEHEVDVILGGYQLNTGPEYDVVADAGHALLPQQHDRDERRDGQEQSGEILDGVPE